MFPSFPSPTSSSIGGAKWFKAFKIFEASSGRTGTEQNPVVNGFNATEYAVFYAIAACMTACKSGPPMFAEQLSDAVATASVNQLDQLAQEIEQANASVVRPTRPRHFRTLKTSI